MERAQRGAGRRRRRAALDQLPGSTTLLTGGDGMHPPGARPSATASSTCRLDRSDLPGEDADSTPNHLGTDDADLDPARRRQIMGSLRRQEPRRTPPARAWRAPGLPHGAPPSTRSSVLTGGAGRARRWRGRRRPRPRRPGLDGCGHEGAGAFAGFGEREGELQEGDLMSGGGSGRRGVIDDLVELGL